ncbi:MAG TPA: hypothetical protein VLJ79_13315 [Candidatus Binatia bacterium]|jgi:hypothetical protein|nr:hypothetical protein [Candidatus Binatia bacterium]
MESNFIPKDVAQFILEKIDSIAQLEALLLLRSNPEEKWSIGALAGRLYIDEKQTAELLVRLSVQGFVLSSSDEPRLYKYQPSSMELRGMVERLAEIYSKLLVPVTNLIHSKPKTRIQEFADAFKLRKDD